MDRTWGVWTGRAWRLAVAVGRCNLLVLCSLLVLWPTPLRADNAPLQPTTAGLVPGVAGTTVRMAAEKVDVHVVERDGAVHALVSASFDMFNRGPTVTLTTGFPKFGGTYFVPGGFAGFDPTQFADFRASSGATVFQPTIQSVKLSSDSIFSGDWYVWQMEYPANTTINVEVSYDQTISPEINGYTYVSYILRTGMLWDSTIGDATITMSTDTGGAFLLPSNDEVKQSVSTQIQPVPESLPNGGLPASSSPTQVSWHLTDFKPSFDPFVFYVPADAWQRFSSAETRLAAGAASADDYAAGVQAYFDARGRLPGGLPWVIRHGTPQALNTRLDEVAAWATEATNLDPNDPAASEALGDVQFVQEVRPAMFLQCRPQLAPAAYQRAVDLGSSAAQGKLDDVTQLVRTGVEVSSGGIHGCSLDPNQPVIDVIPDTLTDAVRAEILDAVSRANQAWKDTTFNLNPSELDGWVDGDLLRSDQAEIEQLRHAGQRRVNTNTDFEVLDVALDAPGHAVVRTRETWSAVITSMATGAVLQRVAPTTYNETYIVEFHTGGWIVTRNDV